ncbi:DUF4132 domain-containing protein [Glycomyces sp. NRRL B-16210]|uniref:DUF4132 domain-containing protein n=1 Tax=Glycomyces sp. NRRL B-16210 TaxID=1463821 RepID=UPI0005566E9B|nr:DUF4132 domain-containing protein [Glycomyces sp. NRRL B-16210]
MTEPVAAQEDQANLPPEWAALVLPRRGNGVRSPNTVDPAAVAAVAARIEAAREHFEAALERPETDPGLARAARAHLGGEPDPAGAGAVITLLRFTRHYHSAMFRVADERADRCAELFAHLAAAHGLPFAVAALIEDFGIGIRWYQDPEDRPERLPALVPGEPSSLKWMLLGGRGRLLAFVRARIADAAPEEYERLVALAGEHRDTPPKRLAAALFLPDQTAWVTEVCRERRTATTDLTVDPLLWASLGERVHADLLGAEKFAGLDLQRNVLAELVAALGPDALPLLTAALGRKRLDFKQRSALYEAIALVPSDAAADLLVRCAGEAEVLTGLRCAALHASTRFASAVARADDLPAADAIRLCGALRQEDVPLEATLKDLDERDRAAVEALLDKTVPTTAGPGRLPDPLTEPAWTQRAKRRPAAPLEGLTAPAGTAIVWGEGEYERAMAIEPEFSSWDPETYWVDPADLGLNVTERFWGRLARGGAPVADAVVARMRDKPKYAQAIVPIRSAAAAALVADWFGRLKSARAHAVDWLDRHGEHAVPLLAPAALGGNNRERAGGEAALRYLGLRLGPDAVLRAAEPHGPEALTRVRDLLAAHPHTPLAGPAPKPGPWADPAMLPPVMLRGTDPAQPRAALPRASVHHLIAALSLWSTRIPFPGTDLYTEHCEPDSLRRFSLALFELWLRAEAPSKDSWAVDQLGCFGDDATAAVLGPLAFTWPGRGQADRALLAIEVLAHIGTDTAFTHLRAIALADRSRAVSQRAWTLAGRLAAARGLDIETYADRLVPDHGVTDPETLTFDYGPRRFHASFDHLLNPHLADETGKIRKSLPKPGVRDDAPAAKAAITRYKRLVKTVATEAETQIERLRTAMLDGRTWNPDAFAALLDHPLVRPFATRLVWFSGTGFRIAEDGGFADVHDREFTPEGPIRLAHPALLGPDTPAWAALLGDYEVLQPFDQLTRPSATFTADELATGRLTRFDGTTAAFATLAETLGWTHRFTSPQDGTDRTGNLERPIPGGWLLADADPRPEGFAPEPTLRLTLNSVRLTTTRNRHPDHARPLPGHRLDPVTAAELIDGLAALTRDRLS